MQTTDTEAIDLSKRVFAKLKTDAKNGNQYALSILKEALKNIGLGHSHEPTAKPEPAMHRQEHHYDKRNTNQG